MLKAALLEVDMELTDLVTVTFSHEGELDFYTGRNGRSWPMQEVRET